MKLMQPIQAVYEQKQVQGMVPNGQQHASCRATTSVLARLAAVTHSGTLIPALEAPFGSLNVEWNIDCPRKGCEGR